MTAPFAPPPSLIQWVIAGLILPFAALIPFGRRDDWLGWSVFSISVALNLILWGLLLRTLVRAIWERLKGRHTFCMWHRWLQLRVPLVEKQIGDDWSPWNGNSAMRDYQYSKLHYAGLYSEQVEQNWMWILSCIGRFVQRRTVPLRPFDTSKFIIWYFAIKTPGIS